MQQNMKRRAFAAAFPYTVPILAGFLFLGMAYGIYAKVSGFGVWYVLAMSVCIYGGSLEFVTVSMLLGAFAPLQTLIVTLMIQARHLFYGIAMLDRFRGTGLKKLYLIFGMCDETFSVTCTAEPPEGVDRGWFMLFITLLDHFYWVAGAVIGAAAGSVFTFNTEGLDFVMTAMFVVIFLEQWMKNGQHWPALIGLAASGACLAVFGADSFLLPSMAVILAFLTALRRPPEKGGEAK